MGFAHSIPDLESDSECCAQISLLMHSEFQVSSGPCCDLVQHNTEKKTYQHIFVLLGDQREGHFGKFSPM